MFIREVYCTKYMNTPTPVFTYAVIRYHLSLLMKLRMHAFSSSKLIFFLFTHLGMSGFNSDFICRKIFKSFVKLFLMSPVKEFNRPAWWSAIFKGVIYRGRYLDTKYKQL